MSELQQRDYMRILVYELGGQKEAVCSAYAKAERDGLVARRRNANDLAPEAYAEALWADGIAKGWL